VSGAAISQTRPAKPTNIRSKENEWRAIQNKTTNFCVIEIANIISHWQRVS